MHATKKVSYLNLNNSKIYKKTKNYQDYYSNKYLFTLDERVKYGRGNIIAIIHCTIDEIIDHLCRLNNGLFG